MKRKTFQTEKPLLGIKKILKKPYFISAVAIFVVVACVTTTICISATEKEGVEVPGLATEIVEAPTEASTEMPTEAPTEAPVEETAPVEEPTEAPTEEYVKETVPVEEPVEEPTEALVEEPVEFNYIPRDSIIDGTPIDFTPAGAWGSKIIPVNVQDLYNISIPPFEKTLLKVIQSTEEFEAVLSLMEFETSEKENYFRNEPQLEKYDDSFFSENALIFIFEGIASNVNSIVKDGSELCIRGETYDYDSTADSTMRPSVEPPEMCGYGLTEIKKTDLDGIDTVSFCYCVIER